MRQWRKVSYNLQDLKKKKLVKFKFIKELKTIIFDLDETLIHVSKSTKGADFKIPVKLKDGKIIKVKFLGNSVARSPL